MYIWFPDKTPDLSECLYDTPLPEAHKKSFGNNLGHFSFLLGVLYGFRTTSQASRYKARKHKLRRCRFRAVISAMFNYRCCFAVGQEKTEKMSFWTGFTRFTLIFIFFHHVYPCSPREIACPLGGEAVISQGKSCLI